MCLFVFTVDKHVFSAYDFSLPIMTLRHVPNDEPGIEEFFFTKDDHAPPPWPTAKHCPETNGMTW
jgi:hypothetical protein